MLSSLRVKQVMKLEGISPQFLKTYPKHLDPVCTDIFKSSLTHRVFSLFQTDYCKYCKTVVSFCLLLTTSSMNPWTQYSLILNKQISDTTSPTLQTALELIIHLLGCVYWFNVHLQHYKCQNWPYNSWSWVNLSETWHLTFYQAASRWSGW